LKLVSEITQAHPVTHNNVDLFQQDISLNESGKGLFQIGTLRGYFLSTGDLRTISKLFEAARASMLDSLASSSSQSCDILSYVTGLNARSTIVSLSFRHGSVLHFLKQNKLQLSPDDHVGLALTDDILSSIERLSKSL